MAASKKQTDEQVPRFADMFSALGTESRLRIMRLLLSAHPDGMVVGDIIAELERELPRVLQRGQKVASQL